MGRSITYSPAMSSRPLVVTARPTGDARWRMDVPGQQPIVTRTLVTAQAMAGRRLGVPFDLQVSLGGLEDLCSDAIELGEQSDALTIQAIRQRRTTARALAQAGIRRTDIAYLMCLGPRSIGHLLSVPIDSPWMATGHAPPSPFPRPSEPSPSVGTTRQMTAIVATRDGTGWHVHLKPGRRPTGRTSLVHAEKLARDLMPDIDVMLCPELPDELEDSLRASHLAGAEAEDHQRRAYELRLDVTRRLRGLGIGFADIGHLLGLHVHRVRLLLGRVSSACEFVVEDLKGAGEDA